MYNGDDENGGAMYRVTLITKYKHQEVFDIELRTATRVAVSVLMFLTQKR